MGERDDGGHSRRGRKGIATVRLSRPPPPDNVAQMARRLRKTVREQVTEERQKRRGRSSRANKEADELDLAPELRKWFEKHDRNGDGLLDVKEFQSIVRSLPGQKDRTEADVVDLIAYFDTDNDHVMNVDEFVNLISYDQQEIRDIAKNVRATLRRNQWTDRRYAQYFQELKEERSSDHLSVEDLHRWIRDLHIELTMGETETLYKFLDRSNDGVVEADEFVAFLGSQSDDLFEAAERDESKVVVDVAVTTDAKGERAVKGKPGWEPASLPDIVGQRGAAAVAAAPKVWVRREEPPASPDAKWNARRVTDVVVSHKSKDTGLTAEGFEVVQPSFSHQLSLPAYVWVRRNVDDANPIYALAVSTSHDTPPFRGFRRVEGDYNTEKVAPAPAKASRGRGGAGGRGPPVVAVVDVPPLSLWYHKQDFSTDTFSLQHRKTQADTMRILEDRVRAVLRTEARRLAVARTSSGQGATGVSQSPRVSDEDLAGEFNEVFQSIAGKRDRGKKKSGWMRSGKDVSAVTRKQFSAGLKKLGFNIPQDDMQVLLTALDAGRADKIRLDSFLKFLRCDAVELRGATTSFLRALSSEMRIRDLTSVADVVDHILQQTGSAAAGRHGTSGRRSASPGRGARSTAPARKERFGTYAAASHKVDADIDSSSRDAGSLTKHTVVEIALYLGLAREAHEQTALLQGLGFDQTAFLSIADLQDRIDHFRRQVRALSKAYSLLQGGCLRLAAGPGGKLDAAKAFKKFGPVKGSIKGSKLLEYIESQDTSGKTRVDDSMAVRLLEHVAPGCHTHGDEDYVISLPVFEAFVERADEEEKLEETAVNIRELVHLAERKRVKVQRVFERLDHTGKGELTVAEFRDGLKKIEKDLPSSTKFRAKYTPQDLNELFALFDRDRSGTLSLAEFFEFVHRDADEPLPFIEYEAEKQRLLTAAAAKGATSAGDGAAGMKQAIPEDQVVACARHIRQLISDSKKAGMKVVSMFEKLDKGGDGEVDCMEIIDGLYDLLDQRPRSQQQKLEFTESEVTELLSRFDANGDGTLNIDEFLDFAEGRPDDPIPPARDGGAPPPAPDEFTDEELKAVAATIRDIVFESEKKGAKLSKILREMDTSGDGALSAQEIADGLSKLREKLSSRRREKLEFRLREIEAIADRFDEDGDGLFTIDEFIAFAREDPDEPLPPRRAARTPKSKGVIDAGDVAARARRIIQKNRYKTREISDFFNRLDRKGRGLSPEELGQGLFDFLIADAPKAPPKADMFSEKEAIALAAAFDVNFDEKISVEEFIDWVTGDTEIPQARKRGGSDGGDADDLQELVDRVRRLERACEKKGRMKRKEVERVFEKIAGRKMALSVDQLLDGLEELGASLPRKDEKKFSLTLEEAEALHELLDRDGGGTVDVDEFLDVVEQPEGTPIPHRPSNRGGRGRSRGRSRDREPEERPSPPRRGRGPARGRDSSEKRGRRAARGRGGAGGPRDRSESDEDRAGRRPRGTRRSKPAPKRARREKAPVPRHVKACAADVRRLVYALDDPKLGVDVEKVFTRLDVDNSGTLSEDEFVRGMRGLEKKQSTKLKRGETKYSFSDDDLRELYGWFDKEKDGSVSIAELMWFAGADPKDELPFDTADVTMDEIRETATLVRDIVFEYDDLERTRSKGRALKTVEEILRSFDSDRSGTLCKLELRNGLYKLLAALPNATQEKMKFSDRRVNALYERFDGDGGPEGYVTIDEFLELANGHPEDPLPFEVAKLSRSELESCCRKVRELVLACENKKRGKRVDVQQIFEDLCEPGTDHIRKCGLRAGTRKLLGVAGKETSKRAGVTDAEVNALYEQFDQDGDGMLSIDEWLDFVEGDIDDPLPGGGKRAPPAILARVAALIQRTDADGRSAKRVFKRMDLDGDGALSLDEMKLGLRRLSDDDPSGEPPLTQEEIELFVDKIDRNSDGLIDLAEFLRFAQSADGWEELDKVLLPITEFDVTTSAREEKIAKERGFELAGGDGVLYEARPTGSSSKKHTASTPVDALLWFKRLGASHATAGSGRVCAALKLTARGSSAASLKKAGFAPVPKVRLPGDDKLVYSRKSVKELKAAAKRRRRSSEGSEEDESPPGSAVVDIKLTRDAESPGSDWLEVGSWVVNAADREPTSRRRSAKSRGRDRSDATQRGTRHHDRDADRYSDEEDELVFLWTRKSADWASASASAFAASGVAAHVANHAAVGVEVLQARGVKRKYNAGAFVRAYLVYQDRRCCAPQASGPTSGAGRNLSWERNRQNALALLWNRPPKSDVVHSNRDDIRDPPALRVILLSKDRQELGTADIALDDWFEAAAIGHADKVWVDLVDIDRQESTGAQLQLRVKVAPDPGSDPFADEDLIVGSTTKSSSKSRDPRADADSDSLAEWSDVTDSDEEWLESARGPAGTLPSMRTTSGTVRAFLYECEDLHVSSRVGRYEGDDISVIARLTLRSDDKELPGVSPEGKGSIRTKPAERVDIVDADDGRSSVRLGCSWATAAGAKFQVYQLKWPGPAAVKELQAAAKGGSNAAKGRSRRDSMMSIRSRRDSFASHGLDSVAEDGESRGDEASDVALVSVDPPVMRVMLAYRDPSMKSLGKVGWVDVNLGDDGAADGTGSESGSDRSSPRSERDSDREADRDSRAPRRSSTSSAAQRHSGTEEKALQPKWYTLYADEAGGRPKGRVRLATRFEATLEDESGQAGMFAGFNLLRLQTTAARLSRLGKLPDGLRAEFVKRARPEDAPGTVSVHTFKKVLAVLGLSEGLDKNEMRALLRFVRVFADDVPSKASNGSKRHRDASDVDDDASSGSYDSRDSWRDGRKASKKKSKTTARVRASSRRVVADYALFCRLISNKSAAGLVDEAVAQRAERLVLQAQECLSRAPLKPSKVFSAFEEPSEHGNRLTLPLLQRGFALMGCEFSAADIGDIGHAVGAVADSHGRINHEALVRLIMAYSPEDAAETAPATRAALSTPLTPQEMVLRDRVRGCHWIMNHMDLVSVFAARDEEGSGRISQSDFQEVLESLGVALSASDVLLLMGRLDRDHTGRLDYAAFAEMIELDADELKEIATRLGAALDSLPPEVNPRDQFSLFDPLATMSVTISEFKQGVRGLGLPLSATETALLGRRFAGPPVSRGKDADAHDKLTRELLRGTSAAKVERLGRVKYDDFLQFCAGVGRFNRDVVDVAPETKPETQEAGTGGAGAAAPAQPSGALETLFSRDNVSSWLANATPLQKAQFTSLARSLRSGGPAQQKRFVGPGAAHATTNGQVDLRASMPDFRTLQAMQMPGGMGAAHVSPRSGLGHVSSSMDGFLTPPRKGRAAAATVGGRVASVRPGTAPDRAVTAAAKRRAAKERLSFKQRQANYKETGKWTCPVCSFTSTAKYTKQCEICASDNPYASSVNTEMQWLCAVCMHANEEGAKRCTMCATELTAPGSPRSEVAAIEDLAALGLGDDVLGLGASNLEVLQAAATGEGAASAVPSGAASAFGDTITDFNNESKQAAAAAAAAAGGPQTPAPGQWPFPPRMMTPMGPMAASMGPMGPPMMTPMGPMPMPMNPALGMTMPAMPMGMGYGRTPRGRPRSLRRPRTAGRSPPRRRPHGRGRPPLARGPSADGGGSGASTPAGRRESERKTLRRPRSHARGFISSDDDFDEEDRRRYGRAPPTGRRHRW